MIETQIPDINVEELKEKVRAEVRERKKRGAMPPRTVPHASDAPGFRPYSKVDFSKISSVGEPEPFQQKDEGYHINDFLKYHDQQFVINAYRGILTRGPDSEGLNYFLKGLHTAKLSKADILGRLRYSPEGRARNVKVRGLLLHFCVQSLFKIPILGYFCRLMISILNLPTLVSNVQIIDSSSAAQFQQQGQTLRELSKMFEKAMDEVIASEREWRVSLEQRLKDLEYRNLSRETVRDDASARIRESGAGELERHKFA